MVAPPDRELTRRIVAANADSGAVNGWLARQLPGLFTDLGLINVRARGFMPLEREADSFYAGAATRAAEVAAQMGAITHDEWTRWREALYAECAAGHFLGGRLHLFVWGTRPPA